MVRWMPAERRAMVEADLVNLYEDYNRRYFDGRLPRIKIHVIWIDPKLPEPTLIGEYDLAAGTIFLFSSDEGDYLTLRTTLLHEMVHVAVPEDAHGPGFRAELQRLAKAGAEDAEFEIWRMVGDDAWDDGWYGVDVPVPKPGLSSTARPKRRRRWPKSRERRPDSQFDLDFGESDS